MMIYDDEKTEFPNVSNHPKNGISKFQTPLAAKLCQSPPQFFLILTQCIPYYQSGMVSMSRGRVDEEEDDDDDDDEN